MASDLWPKAWTQPLPAAHWSSICLGALAQFERNLIVERTQAGLKAATTHGRKGGRKPVVTHKNLEQARAHISDELTVREATARLKVSKTSLYKALGDQKPN